MEPRPIFNGSVVYRERGAFLRRQEQIEKAKATYDVAFDITQEDVQQLLGRSQVCSDAVIPELAYENAEMALRLEPGNMNARNMQARAMYTMSDFERSLVMNYRGSWRRKKPPYFLEGISQGVETIEDCVGKRAGTVMIDFLPLIKINEELLGVDSGEHKKVEHVSRIPQKEESMKLSQLEVRKSEVLARVLALKYLGPLANDKFFLATLRADDRVKSANKRGTADILDAIKKAYRTLEERQEMLRTQRPYYSVKLAEKTHSTHQKKFAENLLLNERRIGARTAESYLRQMQICLLKLAVKQLIAIAQQMQTFLDTKTPRTLPDKEIYIDRLYRLVGEAYLCQHRLSYKKSEQGNRHRIAFLMGLPTGRPTSYDSVRANYPYKYVDLEKVTAKTAEAIELCENMTMKCWLLYEMARYLLQQKNYALSKFYAKQLQRQAQVLNNVTWWMNGCYVLMSGDMQNSNANDVRILVEEAWNWAKQCGDAAGVQAFLTKCLEIANRTVNADENKAILERQRQILRVMDEASRVETEVLFKRMATVPGGRRLKVLPQKRTGPLDTTSVRRTRHQRGLTVVPGPTPVLPKPPKSHVLGYVKFDN